MTKEISMESDSWLQSYIKLPKKLTWNIVATRLNGCTIDIEIYMTRWFSFTKHPWIGVDYINKFSITSIQFEFIDRSCIQRQSWIKTWNNIMKIINFLPSLCNILKTYCPHQWKMLNQVKNKDPKRKFPKIISGSDS